MNCQEFWNTMPELGGSRFEVGPAAREHWEQCAACAARLRSQSALKAGLRAVAGQMSQAGAPARLESHLRAAFRAHNGIPACAPRPHWPIPTWATAAVIALAMFLVRQPAQIATDDEIDGVTAGVTATANSGFMVLPDAAEIGPNEDVNMVRVEVPRSAMIALGLEVNPDQAWQPVEADVMLGADGLARAVRFLD